MRLCKLTIVILAFICSKRIIGQNLVNNPSFEEHSILEIPNPNGDYHIHTMALNWLSASQGVPNYATIECDTIYQWNYNPLYSLNGNVNPRNGKACASFSIYDNNYIPAGFDNRQYSQTNLITGIEAGKYYKVGFYVRLAKNCRYSGNGMGILFTNSQIYEPTNQGLFSYSPQVYFPEMITNTQEWVKKEKYFKSNFNSSYMTIGFFAPLGLQQLQSNYVNVPISPTTNAPIPWLMAVVNYVDDVYVIPIEAHLEADSAVCKGASATLTVRNEVEWKWVEASNPNVIIGTDSILTVTPSATTTYIYYGFSDTIEHTVYVRNPPLFKMGADTFLCKGSTLVLTPELEGQRYWWNTGDTTQSISVTETGAYKVTIQHGPCFVSDDVFVGFAAVPEFVQLRDTSVCKGESVSYFINEPFSQINWNKEFHQNEYLIDTSGTQSVEIINVCGTFQKEFTIEHRECPCLVWVPNAFSPNGDGVNDSFLIQADCRLEDFWYEIYDRWGNRVFKSEDLNEPWIPDTHVNSNLFVVKYYYKGKDNADIVEKLKIKDIIIIK